MIILTSIISLPATCSGRRGRKRVPKMVHSLKSISSRVKLSQAKSPSSYWKPQCTDRAGTTASSLLMDFPETNKILTNGFGWWRRRPASLSWFSWSAQKKQWSVGVSSEARQAWELTTILTVSKKDSKRCRSKRWRSLTTLIKKTSWFASTHRRLLEKYLQN